MASLEQRDERSMRCFFRHKMTGERCALERGHEPPHMAEKRPAVPEDTDLDDPSDEEKCAGCGLADCDGSCREGGW